MSLIREGKKLFKYSHLLKLLSIWRERVEKEKPNNVSDERNSRERTHTKPPNNNNKINVN